MNRINNLSDTCTAIYTNDLGINSQSDGFRDPLYIGIELGGTPYEYKPFCFAMIYPDPQCK